MSKLNYKDGTTTAAAGDHVATKVWNGDHEKAGTLASVDAESGTGVLVWKEPSGREAKDTVTLADFDKVAAAAE